jgi:GAF domain-containing protein
MKLNPGAGAYLAGGWAEPAVATVNRPGRTEIPTERNQAALDRIAQMAHELLDAPIACVWLVDEENHLLMSGCGASAPLAMLLSYPFCKQMVASGHPLAVGDGRTHPKLVNAPTVRDGTVRAFAGWPLVDTNEQVIGTICVMDCKPRRWSDSELDLLGELSAVTEELK